MLRALALSAILIPGALTAQTLTYGRANVPEFAPAFTNQTRAGLVQSDIDLRTETVAQGLTRPWGIDRLPDGSYLVTERPGRLRLITPAGDVSAPISGVPTLLAERQGGLLDVELSPDFATDRTVFLSYSKPLGGGQSTLAVARATLSDDGATLRETTDIFVGGPGSRNPMHYGSRVVAAPDGILYITTGEHFSRTERRYAQDIDKTHGKVLRIQTDGTAPADNPFANNSAARPEVFSYGHRNVQGAALRPGTSQLWTIEHGPKGGDELNRIEAGANYGWPVASYGENYNGSSVGKGISDHAGNGFAEPRYYWDPVIAPSGMTFYDGALFPEWQGDVLIAALAGRGIVRVKLDGDRVIEEERLLTDLGRVRDVMVDTDGSLIALTDADGTLVRITRR
ncbi:MAG: PQQ-dependent sugar dehydrogenase [Rhodobacteraceae bacterium]|nr:PQQ-dependent sugar dehydrogenase [Paracoccaceae bacterium]